MTPILECTNLVVGRNGRTVLIVDHLSLEDGQTLAVIGPNGAGKTTLLLALAGLLARTEGEVKFQGRSIGPKGDLAFRRQLGLVLQDPLLLDISVKENVAAGLRFRHLPRNEINRRVALWLENFGISHLGERPAQKLSGGEAQRVSLARAFALQPDILMLDEPFSSLDTPTRTRLLDDLQVQLDETRLTTLFVTHDYDEALQLADQVAVILDGKLKQVGAPEAVFSMPADQDVATFVGVETIIPGVVEQSKSGLLIINSKNHRLQAIGDYPTEKEVFVCLRPEDVTLSMGTEATTASSVRNRLSGSVTRITFQGPLARVSIDCGITIVALITRSSALEMALEPGQPVIASFKATALHVISR